MKKQSTRILDNIRGIALLITVILMFVEIGFQIFAGMPIICIILSACVLACITLVIVLECILKEYKQIISHVCWLFIWSFILIMQIIG